MGLALIIPGADFSADNIGTVTPLGNIPITGLDISGPVSVTGISAKYSAIYTPLNTTERGVLWSISSGAAYASISPAGVLTVLSGASSNNVTVRATSVADSTIYAEKNIVVTYLVQTEINLDDLPIQRGERFPDGTIHYPSGQNAVWGTITEKIPVSGVTSIDAIVPAEKTNFVVEAIYFDENDVSLQSPRYPYASGPWLNAVTVNGEVPANAAYVYVNLAIDQVLYSPTLSDGVTLILTE